MLRPNLNEALKQAMKGKDPVALATVRLILAALKDRDIQARGIGNSDGISDAEILDMLQKMVKQRREAIELYYRGNRPELAAKEEQEIAVIERFLPQPLDESETEAVIESTIAELQAGSIKDMGRVMAALKERFAGRMDFAQASQKIKQRLA